MVRYNVDYLLNGRLVSNNATTNTPLVIPRIGDEVHLSGQYLKVIRVVHALADYNVQVHLSR